MPPKRGLKNEAPSPSPTKRMKGTTSSPPTRPGSRQGVSQETGKASKGLRHFSMKVCKKVEEKGQTTYNEVADELVREFLSSRPLLSPLSPEAKKPKGQYDEKNIRRRVYDALNVLMAMDIISKEKKEIRWKGLPSNAQRDKEILVREKDKVLAEVERKRKLLKELIVQGVCFSNLETHDSDKKVEHTGNKIPLPFIVVNTSQSTVINCEMGSDRTDVFFNFSQPFEINDDNEVMKRFLSMLKRTDCLMGLLRKRTLSATSKTSEQGLIPSKPF
ncbi:hypothetical protein TrVE_jg14397 [Triparma verrucosa]|uniref:Uncharacterized protein n=1 Tax=Triparma verrucosa TaxID=1606542 RepID=A0A9W7BJG1_9STRA|nr:hypothetical protein TrVE_jg14397 [Triparma verrucosa]